MKSFREFASHDSSGRLGPWRKVNPREYFKNKAYHYDHIVAEAAGVSPPLESRYGKINEVAAVINQTKIGDYHYIVFIGKNHEFEEFTQHTEARNLSDLKHEIERFVNRAQ